MSQDSVVFHGVVDWFNTIGMGFINWSKEGIKQRDMFVHYSDIDADGFRMLKPGQKVSFEIGVNHKGQPKAIAVKIIK